MTDSLTNAVAELKGKIAGHVAALKDDENWREIQRLYQGLGVLEDLCKMPKTELTELLGIAADDSVKIGKYEFAGQPPLEAAKQFLRKIAPKQKAASLADILAALESGGLKAKEDDLRISLSRSTMEIYKAGEDIYGLLENFPHIKRGASGPKKKNAQGTDGQVDPSDQQTAVAANGQ